MSDHIEPELLKLKRRKQKELAIVVGVDTQEDADDFDDILDELLQLIYSAGSEVVATVIQKRSSLDPATVIGGGKIEEIRQLVIEEKPDLVIFLNDLKPTQERNLAERLKVKVIDRQALILDIFAQRARTREGKMQVELALLKYLLPRLAGLGPILSRLGGGIGTRGPGETMLETDRRHVRKRIQTLSREIEKLSAHRERLRESRHNKGFLTAALVGYTNAGKSTVLNLLTEQEATVEDKLFATLDPLVGKYYIGEGIEILLVDTVGFIRHLPHQLAAAFKATLEEVQEADIIMHIVDVSHPQWQEQMNVTEQVLEEMACDNKPTLLLLNKTDLLTPEQSDEVLEAVPEGLPVSAVNNEGFLEVQEELLSIIKSTFTDFIERFKKFSNNNNDEEEITPSSESANSPA